MQKAELMIGHCRDLDLLSTTVILFLIGGSELFFADMNSFPLKMIFAAAEDTNIVILLAGLPGLLMSTSQSLLLILKSTFLVHSVNFNILLVNFCIFSSVRDISRLTELIFSPKNSISCTGVKTDFLQLITKPRCCNKKITVSRHMLISSME